MITNVPVCPSLEEGTGRLQLREGQQCWPQVHLQQAWKAAPAEELQGAQPGRADPARRPRRDAREDPGCRLLSHTRGREWRSEVQVDGAVAAWAAGDDGAGDPPSIPAVPREAGSQEADG